MQSLDFGIDEVSLMEPHELHEAALDQAELDAAYPHFSESAKQLAQMLPLRACIEEVMATGLDPNADFLAVERVKCASYARHTGEWYIPLWYRLASLPAALGTPSTWSYAGYFFSAAADLKPATVLECERCGAFYNLDFCLRVPSKDVDRANVVSISYVHCELNNVDGCQGYETPGWLSRMDKMAEDRRALVMQFVNVFRGSSPADLARSVLGHMGSGSNDDEKDDAGKAEIRLGYLACRLLWHLLVFRSRLENELPSGVRAMVSLSTGSLPAGLPYMHLWGDLRNDFTLFQMGKLSAKDMSYAYDLDPEVIEYMMADFLNWALEVQFVNEYTTRRRVMPKAIFSMAKRAVQRASTAMKRALAFTFEDVVAPEGYISDSHRSQASLQAALLVKTARLRFQELHSATMAELDESHPRMVERSPK